MTEETTSLIDYIDSIKDDYLKQRQLAIEVEAGPDFPGFYDEVTTFLAELSGIVAISNFKVNYISQFRGELDNFQAQLPYKSAAHNNFSMADKGTLAALLCAFRPQIEVILERARFKLHFFKVVDFFDHPIVLVGANGSGKTSLSNKFSNYLALDGLVVYAQRILLIPSFDTIRSADVTRNALKDIQQKDKTNKNEGEFGILQSEFQVVLRNLISENLHLAGEYKKTAAEAKKKGVTIPDPPVSRLDRTLDIWNGLIPHRVIACKDGMNISVSVENGRDYPAIQMSDGEKVALFLISQILQAPDNGFIIIDEPEMYLHKTILQKLWDTLENQRVDCVFIYLIHDVDFAATRITAKKIWVKSFAYPDRWDMEPVPKNDLPEPMLLELLGSRKNILFCEGQKGSTDEKLYNILFQGYTVTPVGSCFEVISHTKAFNQLKNVSTKAIGLIDSDHHPLERLSGLAEKSVYHFKAAEVENLLLDEAFLQQLAPRVLADPAVVGNIKTDVLQELNNQKAIQAANFVAARIDYYFKDTNFIKGNSPEHLESNFDKFTGEIRIREFYWDRLRELDTIVATGDYEKSIAVYNNKGISRFVEQHFQIKDFREKALKLLCDEPGTHSAILKYFPRELRPVI